MTIALYTDRQHPEEAHETYTFKFVYAPDGEATLTIDAKGDKSLFGKEVCRARPSENFEQKSGKVPGEFLSI